LHNDQSYTLEGKTPGAAAYKFFKFAINTKLMKNRPKPNDCGGWEGITIIPNKETQ